MNKILKQKINLGKHDKSEYNYIAKLTRSAKILLNKLNLFK
jgi:hypothetical protein